MEDCIDAVMYRFPLPLFGGCSQPLPCGSKEISVPLLDLLHQCMQKLCQCRGNCMKCCPECTCYKCKCSPQGSCRCECKESPSCLGCFCLKLADPPCYCVKVKKPCCGCFTKNKMQRKISQSKSAGEKYEKGFLGLLEKDLDKAIVQRLICPSCRQFYSQPCTLPCEHHLCKPCVEKLKTQAATSTEPCLFIKCPVCQCAYYFQHNDLKLPNDYLRAIILKKYCTRKGISLPKGSGFTNIVYCQHCPTNKKREAAMRCRTCKQQFYCNICLSKHHNHRMLELHNITEFIQREEKTSHCFYHPQKFITKYCFTCKALLCEDCNFELHEDHNTLSLSEACAEESHALFSAIAKYKRAKYGLETDLLEFSILRSNFKMNKDNRKKEIRHGFLNLHAILNEKEKNILENIDNMENEKQKMIMSFLNKSAQIAYSMEGLMQYAKEALKEENQIVFLQSANTLVNEINNEATNIYQPDPCMRLDPIKNLSLNFNQISSSLQILFPSPINKHSQMESTESDPQNPYVSSSGHEICAPKCIPSGQLMPCKTTSCKEADIPDYPFDIGKDENNERAKSLPPIAVPKSDVCRFWQEYPPNAGNVKDRDCDYYWNHSASLENATGPPPVPGQVTIYQTIAYPTAAKVFWTTPDDDVEFYDAEFHEVLPDKPEDCSIGDFSGNMSGIKQQCMELHNLSPSGEYLFRVRAVNSTGKGEWSEVLKLNRVLGLGSGTGDSGTEEGVQLLILEPPSSCSPTCLQELPAGCINSQIWTAAYSGATLLPFRAARVEEEEEEKESSTTTAFPLFSKTGADSTCPSPPPHHLLESESSANSNTSSNRSTKKANPCEV
ncbi:tripartite motif-containing protein 42 [Microcaecilia unicolor]|uniref:Tripartite motif-containing protein 42 n=1 Tax=Microcaecilia unicolor TaxID=1415580 RepID=A0A6P7Z4D4_9AMPH|nr:tripartite motif-containing protein 42 [Microcaecilia unicolor]